MQHLLGMSMALELDNIDIHVADILESYSCRISLPWHT